MEKTWQKDKKRVKCKNCGKRIYLSGHDVWYHCNDDNDICGANKPVDFNHIFDKAEPEVNLKEGRNSSQD